MRPPEYIGVSGVVNQDQQAELERMFEEAGLRGRRTLQLGVKATHKPQYLGVENRHGREWYPVGDEIDEALRYNSEVMGVAQICFDGDEVHDDTYRREFLCRALGGTIHRWLTGVQFDMMPNWCINPEATWKTLENGVYYLADSAKGLTTTLQCQGEIMAGYTPVEVADALALMPTPDYVLFDASGGRGIRMDADALLPYIERVYRDSRLQYTNVAIGGGLNAEVVRTELPKILRHFPDVSWDAEGQLHPVNANGKRPLDMNVCRDYLQASAEVLA